MFDCVENKSEAGSEGGTKKKVKQNIRNIAEVYHLNLMKILSEIQSAEYFPR